MPDMWRDAEDYAHFCGEGAYDEPPEPIDEDADHDEHDDWDGESTPADGLSDDD